MTSQPGWQTVAIHLLPNISRSKGNETMRFTKTHLQNMVERVFPDPFLKNEI